MQFLKKKPSERLGFNGIAEVKAHPWFRSVDWNLLAQKKVYIIKLMYLIDLDKTFF